MTRLNVSQNFLQWTRNAKNMKKLQRSRHQNCFPRDWCLSRYRGEPFKAPIPPPETPLIITVEVILKASNWASITPREVVVVDVTTLKMAGKPVKIQKESPAGCFIRWLHKDESEKGQQLPTEERARIVESASNIPGSKRCDFHLRYTNRHFKRR